MDVSSTLLCGPSSMGVSWTVQSEMEKREREREKRGNIPGTDET